MPITATTAAARAALNRQRHLTELQRRLEDAIKESSKPLVQAALTIGVERGANCCNRDLNGGSVDSTWKIGSDGMLHFEWLCGDLLECGDSRRSFKCTIFELADAMELP